MIPSPGTYNLDEVERLGRILSKKAFDISRSWNDGSSVYMVGYEIWRLFQNGERKIVR